MGFIIHKYFLSKSLKAPPPSDSKKKKGGKTSRRSGPPAGTADLSIPDYAYANNSNSGSSGYARRRRGSMSSAPSSSSFRRASMPIGGTQISEEHSTDDYVGSLGLGLGKQKSFRRASLQADSMYMHQEEESNSSSVYGYGDVEDTTFSRYYGHQMEDTREEPADGEWEDNSAPMQRRFSRRSSTGSGASNISGDDGSGSGMGALPARLRQENRWLQVQLKQIKHHCAHLEAKLYGARDQIAYTNASWMDQLYDTQHKHLQEVFQSQRQAEKASNAVLEQEFEDLRKALTRVAHEDAKLEEKKKRLNMATNESSATCTSKATTADDQGWKEGNEEYDVKQIHAELTEWKERHAQAIRNAKRIQDILEQEALERNAVLQESERRVQWLEEELKAVIPSVGGEEQDTKVDYHDPDFPLNRRHVALLHQHQSQLEERIQELLFENSQLQRDQAQRYELQTQVKELEAALSEAEKKEDLHQTLHGRQLEYWKQESAKWQSKARQLEERASHQVTSREVIRGEYAHRIETVEAENARLQRDLETKQKQWTHQSNLKERTIESLNNEINRLGGRATLAMIPVAEAPNALERIVESVPASLQRKTSRDQTVATEDTVFDGASSASSISDGPTTEKPPPSALSFCEASTNEIPNNAVVDKSDRMHQAAAAAQQREKELLVQIRLLTESEANAKKHAEQYKQQIQDLEKYLNQEEDQEKMDNDSGNEECVDSH